MKNKTGFTLAEILISLTIIGVVSALTIPAFTESTKKQIWGNALSIAVTNFENALGTLTIKDGSESLLQTETWINIDTNGGGVLNNSSSENVIKHFSTDISSVLKTTKYHKNFKNSYSPEVVKKLSADGLAGDSYDEDVNYVGIESNRKITYWLSLDKTKWTKLSEDEAMDLGTTLTHKIGEVVIDINGNDKPNIIGKDLFKFYLNYDGKLYPVGGQDVDLYEGSGLWSDENSIYSCVDSKIKTGWGCTARLIEENYKINY